MSPPRILIAGIGNIFCGDDAFGVEVIRRMAPHSLPSGVHAVDFGIRGFDLACAILDGYDVVILVDATIRGGSAGTLYVIEPNGESPSADDLALEGHGLTPEHALRWVRMLGGNMPRVRLIGCEPASLGSQDQPQMGLSAAVAEAVDHALLLIRSLVDEIRAECSRGLGTRDG